MYRAESTDHPARRAAIVDALAAFAGDMPVIFPLHPRTRRILPNLGALDLLAAAVFLVDSPGYLDAVQLEKHAA